MLLYSYGNDNFIRFNVNIIRLKRRQCIVLCDYHITELLLLPVKMVHDICFIQISHKQTL